MEHCHKQRNLEGGIADDSLLRCPLVRNVHRTLGGLCLLLHSEAGEPDGEQLAWRIPSIAGGLAHPVRFLHLFPVLGGSDIRDGRIRCALLSAVPTLRCLPTAKTFAILMPYACPRQYLLEPILLSYIFLYLSPG